MSHAVLYLPQFWADIDSSKQWYNKQRPGLGDELADAIDRAADEIQERPESFPVLKGSIRKCVIRRFKYIILFALDPDYLFFLGVSHGARDVDKWLGERTKP